MEDHPVEDHLVEDRPIDVITLDRPKQRRDQDPEDGEVGEQWRDSDSNGSSGNRVKFSREHNNHSSTNKSSEPPEILLVGLKGIIGVVFFIVFLSSSVLSKLTLLSLTDALRIQSMPIVNETLLQGNYMEDTEFLKHKSECVTIYWQLLIILIVPNSITSLRCLFFGFLGKTQNNYPWPKMKAVLVGLVGALLEVLGMCVLVFIVFAAFPVGPSILILSGVFLFQIAIDMLQLSFSKKCLRRGRETYYRRRRGYNIVTGNNSNGLEESYPLVKEDGGKEERDEEDGGKEERDVEPIDKVLAALERLLENRYAKIVAFSLQIIGLVGLLIYWGTTMRNDHNKPFFLRPLIALPLVIFVISMMWTNCYQQRIATARKMQGDSVEAKYVKQAKSARYKSSLINSSFRVFLYPFVSYIVFRYMTPYNHIDPWCLDKTCNIDISGTTLSKMIIHIVASIVGYCVAWIACTMTLSQVSLGIPLILSTPVSLAYYLIDTHSLHLVWPFVKDTSNINVFDSYMSAAYIAGAVMWIGGVLAMSFFMCTKTNIVLAKDEDMFLTPHYDSIFLEQHIILNRRVKRRVQDEELSFISRPKWKQRNIFICSTMYRENDVEMKQMLMSIARVGEYYTDKRKDPKNRDHFESHIFFDGAITGNQVEDFGLQLLSLLEETLHIEVIQGKKTETPYGYTFSWKIGKAIDKEMPFTIHFKDKNKVKPKKRWSQVMYMNYILEYRIKESDLDPNNTFILTTDADIDFTADSAIVLLDMMETNDKVAAVSARTHPKGYGPMYWYQLFDYAIGHWFQKPAEHILGSVLCSPGCFSVFRCSALKKVVEEYATEATNASEFLMKDMGEDRWLCTLIIKKGLRLEYCAISEDYTYCPVEFNEFYKQRRRWIPSTIANLVMLVSESNLITKGNDSISILYIIFQGIMIFSTIISPATIVLVISAGLESFHCPASVSITIFFLVGVIYGLICLYTSPKAQLDMAKLLTFFFSIIMALVFIGIFKDIINGFTGSPTQKLIGPPNCNGFNESSMDYDQCMKSQAFAQNLNNSMIHHFHVPVSITVVYLGVLALFFIFGGIFHFNEITCLIHSVWYLLALPSGYLLLLIYSAANLCDRSWGTREQSSGGDEGIWGWKKHLVKAWNLMAQSRCSLWCCGGPKSSENGGAGGKGDSGSGGGAAGEKPPDQSDKPHPTDEAEKEEGKASGESSKKKPKEDEFDPQQPAVKPRGITEPAKAWLIESQCQMYLPNFEENGYTTRSFIADISQEDLEAIGIDKAGYRCRLMREIRNIHDGKLPLRKFEISRKPTVFEWLKELELDDYTELFHYHGYMSELDMESVALLSEKDLKTMGIRKRAHLQRLVKATGCLTIPPTEMDRESRQWLAILECEHYEEKFVRHGYTTKRFLAGIKDKDLQKVGVEKRGLRLRIQKAARKLPSLAIKNELPANVRLWLKDLELEQYKNIFHREGYRTSEDIENLKELTVDQLKAMGITKTAHLNRLKTALNHLTKPSLAEQKKRKTKGIIDHDMPTISLEVTEEKEFKFWTKLIKEKLEPVALKFTSVKDVQKSLESLRNTVLIGLLLANLMWIVLLYSLTFWQLQKYGIDPRAFQLLFLAVYTIIIAVQFLCMLAHRAVTLIHYLGRVRPEKFPFKEQNHDPAIVLSMAGSPTTNQDGIELVETTRN